MKKIFLLLLVPALIFAFSGCGKDDDGGSRRNGDDGGNGGSGGGSTSAEQKAVLFYFGGTWCPPCGSNGKLAVQNVKNEHGDKVEVISCQLNGASPDPFSNTSSSQLAQAFQVSGVPAIFIGGPAELTGHPSNAQMSSSSVERVGTVIGQSPIVAVKPTVKLDGKTLTVSTNVKFLEDHDNEYRLAVYITESRLEHPQASDARTVDRNMHDDVIRKNLSPSSAFGELLGSSVSKDSDSDYSFFDELDDSWNVNNLKAVAVVWKRMPTGFLPVNAASVKIK